MVFKVLSRPIIIFEGKGKITNKNQWSIEHYVVYLKLQDGSLSYGKQKRLNFKSFSQNINISISYVSNRLFLDFDMSDVVGESDLMLLAS